MSRVLVVPAKLGMSFLQRCTGVFLLISSPFTLGLEYVGVLSVILSGCLNDLAVSPGVSVCSDLDPDPHSGNVFLPSGSP